MTLYISAHAADVAKDIAAAKALYAPAAEWSAQSLALDTQAVLQGAFVLAKSKGGPEVARDCLAHLRRYLLQLFNRPPDQKRSDDQASTSGTFIWYDVMTHDTKAAAAFYSDVIGWDAQENQMPDNRIYTVFTKGADDGCGRLKPRPAAV